MVLEFGVVEVAPLVLPAVVESLFDSEEEFGFVPLSAERWQALVPNKSAEPRRTASKNNVSFLVSFMGVGGLWLA